mmetsp:Transcript_10788/g.16036  ORF Transcript_10788/g.16036 Transcript_10788/m.16036 type:complete len:294 (-) Transcript_10788:204-1085(-)
MSKNFRKSSASSAGNNAYARVFVASEESESKKTGKGSWSVEEDRNLIQLVEKHGRSWKKISSFLAGRNGKQCRERFVNHLEANIKKGEWSEEDDRKLQTLQSKYGNKWASIAQHMSGRPPCEVKNRFNTLKRRAQKTANECQGKKVISSKARTSKKAIHHESVTTYLIGQNKYSNFNRKSISTEDEGSNSRLRSSRSQNMQPSLRNTGTYSLSARGEMHPTGVPSDQQFRQDETTLTGNFYGIASTGHSIDNACTVRSTPRTEASSNYFANTTSTPDQDYDSVLEMLRNIDRS